jgi:hypothetical protein
MIATVVYYYKYQKQNATRYESLFPLFSLQHSRRLPPYQSKLIDQVAAVFWLFPACSELARDSFNAKPPLQQITCADTIYPNAIYLLIAEVIKQINRFDFTATISYLCQPDVKSKLKP